MALIRIFIKQNEKQCLGATYIHLNCYTVLKISNIQDIYIYEKGHGGPYLLGLFRGSASESGVGTR